MENQFEKSTLNEVKRNPKRGHYDKKTVFEILDSHFLCHLAYLQGETPATLPTAYGRLHDNLFVHGAYNNHALRNILSTSMCSLTITHLDGLVLARSAFHHSINYRSVVVFGQAEEVTSNDEKMEALKIISDNIILGRWEEVRSPTPNELKATCVVKIQILTASAKIRTGDPKDDDEDYNLPIWAGVLPLAVRNQKVESDAKLLFNLDVPKSVVQYNKFHLK